MDFTTTRKDGAVTTSTPGMPSGAGDDFGAVIAKIMQSRQPQAPARAPRLAGAPLARMDPQMGSAPTLGASAPVRLNRYAIQEGPQTYAPQWAGSGPVNPGAHMVDADIEIRRSTPSAFMGAVDTGADKRMRSSYDAAPMNLSGWSGPTVTTDNKGRRK